MGSQRVGHDWVTHFQPHLDSFHQLFPTFLQSSLPFQFVICFLWTLEALLWYFYSIVHKSPTPFMWKKSVVPLAGIQVSPSLCSYSPSSVLFFVSCFLPSKSSIAYRNQSNLKRAERNEDRIRKSQRLGALREGTQGTRLQGLACCLAKQLGSLCS